MEIQATFLNDTLASELCRESRTSPRLRSHRNLHGQLSDPFQRMLVAIQPGSYIRPHRHWLDPKPETVACLAGEIGVLVFDDNGRAIQRGHLRPGSQQWGCDIPAGAWHTLVCLAPDSVFLEAKPGPYVPFQPADFAEWAPEPGSAEAGPYLGQLQELLG